MRAAGRCEAKSPSTAVGVQRRLASLRAQVGNLQPRFSYAPWVHSARL